LRGHGHLVKASVTLPVQPPLGAIHGSAMASRTPPDASADILYWFAGLYDVEHQEAYPLNDPFFHGRRNTHILVYTVAKPVCVQRRAEQSAAAVFDSDNDRAATWGVRHAGHFVSQMPSRLLIVPVAHSEGATRSTSAGLFLEVDLLPFDPIGQHSATELGERAIDEDFQPLASFDLISPRTKRGHQHPFLPLLSD
jgi:hypothetical protein